MFYHSITEGFFNEYSREAKRSAIFTQERSQEGENRSFFYAWAEYLQPNTSRTQLDDFAHEQTIIWRQSFAGQVIGARPVKRKKNSLRMIIDFHVGLNISLSIIAVLSNSLVLVALQRWFALFVRGQKLLFRSLAVRDLLVGFILHPVHVIGLILDYKLSEYGHGVDIFHLSLALFYVACPFCIHRRWSLDRLSALV